LGPIPNPQSPLVKMTVAIFFLNILITQSFYII
jgi:hypothetical protein